MKRIIGVLLILITLFSFNIVNAEEKINHYRVEINELADNTGLTVKEIVEIQSDNHNNFYKYLSKNSTYLTMDRSYIKTSYNNLDLYSFALEPTNTVTMSYDVKDIDDGYYIFDFIPVRSSDEYSKLTYSDINVVIYSSEPAQDSENLIFEPGTYEVETTDNSIIAHIANETSEIPTFTYKTKRNDYTFDYEEPKEAEFNPFKKSEILIFVLQTMVFAVFLTLFTYCYRNREFLKLYMFLIYGTEELLFMLFCASECNPFYIVFILHIFYSMFFIGFLFANQNKKPQESNISIYIFMLIHSFAFLVAAPMINTLTSGEDISHFILLVISTIMFYTCLFMTSDMYNYGHPFEKIKMKKGDSKVNKINNSGVELFRNTEYYQLSKNEKLSNYDYFLSDSPKQWFKFHYNEFKESIFIWYVIAFVVLLTVVPAGYVICLHISYDLMKLQSSIIIDVISFLIPFISVIIIGVIIYIKTLKCFKFKKLYKNGTLIREIPCKIIDFKLSSDSIGFYNYKIACKYSIFDEEKEYISNLKKEYVNSFPKTCDLLIDLDHPDNYYIDFAINRED